jgi:hypothetical protein
MSYISIEDVENSIQQLAPAPAEASEYPIRSSEELLSSWESARSIEDVSNWVLGDIVVEAVRAAQTAQPELSESAAVKAFSELTGAEYSSMRGYAWVSTAFPAREMRKTGLSWSHYRKTVTTKDPMSWIEVAINEHLTVRGLEQRIKEAEGDILVASACCSICKVQLPQHGVIAIYRDGKKEASFDKDECALQYFANTLERKAMVLGAYNNTDTDDMVIIPASNVEENIFA